MTQITPERYCLGCGNDVIARGEDACTCPNGPTFRSPTGLDPLAEINSGAEATEPSILDRLRAALVDSAGLDNIPEPEPLIEGLLYRDSLAWLYGKPGHGKSFVAIDWSGCVAGQLPWQGRDAPNTGPVLYLAAEGVTGIKRRVRAWEDWTGVPMKGVLFLPIAVQLLNSMQLAAFVELLTEIQPAMVVIDTQARVTVGAEENSAKDMGQLVDAVDKIRSVTRACVLLIHHESRAGENIRGSTSLEGAATTMIRVTKDGPHVRLDNTKQKDDAESHAILLKLVPWGESAVLQSQNAMGLTIELSDSQQKIMQTMRDCFETTVVASTMLMNTADVPKATFYRALNGLVKQGLLTKKGTETRPRYCLPSANGLTESQTVSRDQATDGLRSHTPIRGETDETDTNGTPAEVPSPGPDNCPNCHESIDSNFHEIQCLNQLAGPPPEDRPWKFDTVSEYRAHTTRGEHP